MSVGLFVSPICKLILFFYETLCYVLSPEKVGSVVDISVVFEMRLEIFLPHKTSVDL